MEMKYPEYPDADRPNVFEEALRFQDFVVDLLLSEIGLVISNYSSRYYQYNKGESRQGVEIKMDLRILETGNVSIEVAEKSRADKECWTPSGIMRDDNTWLYLQGNYEIIFIFGKHFLRQLYEARHKDKTWEPKHTIRTFLLPIKEAEKYALKVIRPTSKQLKPLKFGARVC
jgi:hypothetical protein